jgi:hypothetical protein
MKFRGLSFSAAALMLVCPFAVYAEPISFGYNFQTPSSVTGDAGNFGVVSFSTTNGGQASGTATLTAASLTAVTSAPSNNPDTFSGETYNVQLQLTDNASGKSGALNFTGKLFGSLTPTAANITTSFSPAMRTLVLGSDLYKVTVGPLVPPTTPNPTVVGTLFATVSAQAEGSQQTVTQTSNSPEPGSLLLGILGVTGFALSRRMARRSAAPV